MKRNSLKLLTCLVAVSMAAPAFADEGELVEKVAVRNRLYTVANRWELGGNVGFSLLSTLTEHYNLNLSGAYNVAEWFAVEARVGYAISRLTSLTNQVRQQQQISTSVVSDLSNLWTMGFNGTVGARFQPFYGKLNLVAELPIHFQLYFWLGAGVGTFSRQSAVFCDGKKPDDCIKVSPDNVAGQPWYKENKVGPLFTGAVGFRFFIAQKHGVRIEIRDWAFLDSYVEGATRANVSAANPSGGGNTVGGLTNVAQIDLGYTFLF